MDKKIDYRKADHDLRKAWFEYKKNNPNQKLRLLDFAAGWNAAKQGK